MHNSLCHFYDEICGRRNSVILWDFDIPTNRTVSYVIVLLELLIVLLEYIDLSVITILISKNSYYCTDILDYLLC